MSLISRLGKRFREKPKSTNLKLPSLPTPREILEDIDSCQSTDSIIAFATLIQKKGRISLLDIDIQKEATTTKDSHLAFLSPYRVADKAPEDSSLQEAKTAAVRRRASIDLNASGVGSRSKKAADFGDQINDYNKLKQFLLLYENSEELIEALDSHFKRLENTLIESTECLTTTANEHNIETGKLEAEDAHDINDVCSSPLM